MFDIFVNNYFVFFIFIMIIYYSFIFYLKDTTNKLIINILFFLNIFEFLLFLNGAYFTSFLYLLNFILYSFYTIKTRKLIIVSNFILIISYFIFNKTDVFFSYIVFLVAIELHSYLNNPKYDNNIRAVLYIFLIISLLVDKLYIGNTFFTLFYFIYLICDFYIKDELTDTLNRKPLKRDLNKNRNQINAIISIDLNNLKIINDTLGHYEGDKAILTLVELIKEIILKDMCLYRVGGDEFLVVCYNANKLEIEEFVKKIKERMNETKYSCAIGVAYKEKNLSLNDLTKIADEAMYEDKKHYKKVR